VTESDRKSQDSFAAQRPPCPETGRHAGYQLARPTLHCNPSIHVFPGCANSHTAPTKGAHNRQSHNGGTPFSEVTASIHLETMTAASPVRVLIADLRANGLLAADRGGTSDPYAVCNVHVCLRNGGGAAAARWGCWTSKLPFVVVVATGHPLPALLQPVSTRDARLSLTPSAVRTQSHLASPAYLQAAVVLVQ
jgi:hypothetical protein